MATFTNLADNKSEMLSLEFTDGQLSPLPTSAILVSPAAPSQLNIHTQPSSTALAGRAFGAQPVVYEEDSFGNLETGDSSTVVMVGLDTGAGPLHGTIASTVAGGVATFAGLADDRAESITLKFTSGSLAAAVSTTTTVGPAADLQLSSFTAGPEPVETGPSLTYTAVVTNRGPSPATSVTLTIPVGATVRFLSASIAHGTVGLQGSLVVANLGTMDAVASASVSVVVSPGVVGKLSSSASITAAETDINLSNNTAIATTSVLDRPGTISLSFFHLAIIDPQSRPRDSQGNQPGPR